MWRIISEAAPCRQKKGLNILGPWLFCRKNSIIQSLAIFFRHFLHTSLPLKFSAFNSPQKTQPGVYFWRMIIPSPSKISRGSLMLMLRASRTFFGIAIRPCPSIRLKIPFRLATATLFCKSSITQVADV